MKNTPRLGPKMVCSYIFLSDLYKYSSSWLHSNFFSNFLMIPFEMESSSFYIPFFHPNRPRVDQIANPLDTCPINTFLKSLWIAMRLEVIV